MSGPDTHGFDRHQGAGGLQALGRAAQMTSERVSTTPRAGLMLVELLITLVILGVIGAVVTGIFLTQTRSAGEWTMFRGADDGPPAPPSGWQRGAIPAPLSAGVATRESQGSVHASARSEMVCSFPEVAAAIGGLPTVNRASAGVFAAPPLWAGTIRTAPGLGGGGGD